MQLLAIICAAVMLPVMATVGAQIIQFRHQVMRGSKCAKCPLYQTACTKVEGDTSVADEAKPLLLTREMVI
jgi:hypothetical protein